MGVIGVGMSPTSMEGNTGLPGFHGKAKARRREEAPGVGRRDADEEDFAFGEKLPSSHCKDVDMGLPSSHPGNFVKLRGGDDACRVIIEKDRREIEVDVHGKVESGFAGDEKGMVEAATTDEDSRVEVMVGLQTSSRHPTNLARAGGDGDALNAP